MKHYFWYRTDGSIGGEMTFSGGFPATCDPSDPNTTEPTAVGLRAKHTAEPEYAGIVGWDCGCPGGGFTFCACCNDKVQNSIIVDGVLTPMTTPDWMVDGVPAPGNDRSSAIDKTPSADVTLKLRSVGIPDGTEVDLRWGAGPEMHQDLPVLLTFTGGETQEITLRAPTQGMRAAVWVFERTLVPVTALHLRGW